MMYSWVRRYIGIPFVSNGRDKTGCDCYGLVRLVLKNEYGLTLPELSDDYADARNSAETVRLFTKNLPVLTAARIPVPEEKAVAVIVEHGQPCHLGIVAGNGYILHTTAKTGGVCQRVTHPGLRGRIEGYYRVR
jgi:cell wall-associated NlpC family hydrolase